ncbi:MAG: RNA-binding S4 domain-containing protein [Rhodobacteraceae bacterium]|nr:RNA-binding S4 domain-containing protein [Paracoccaceae bacterium]
MPSPDDGANTAKPGLRADKWLWQARFFKSRSRAAAIVEAGHLRINGQRAVKPSQTVRVGDTLTFVQERDVRVVRVLALGSRRGPAEEARQLYDDLTPPSEPSPGAPQPLRGRPDRDARRQGRLSRQGPLE